MGRVAAAVQSPRGSTTADAWEESSPSRRSLVTDRPDSTLPEVLKTMLTR